MEGLLFVLPHSSLKANCHVLLMLGLLLMFGGMMLGGKALLFKKNLKIEFMYIFQVWKFLFPEIKL